MSIRDGLILARAISLPSKKKEKKDKRRKAKKQKENATSGTETVNTTPLKDPASSRAQSPSGDIENLSLKGDCAVPSSQTKTYISIDDPASDDSEEEDNAENAPDVEAEDTTEDFADLDLANGKQPKRWKNAGLVVGDPFILTKVSLFEIS